MANVPYSSVPEPVTYTPPRTEPTDARSIHVELLGPVTLNLGNELTIVTYLSDASERVISSTTSPFAIRVTAQVVNGVSEITDVLHTTITPGDGLARIRFLPPTIGNYKIQVLNPSASLALPGTKFFTVME